MPGVKPYLFNAYTYITQPKIKYRRFIRDRIGSERVRRAHMYTVYIYKSVLHRYIHNPESTNICKV